MNAAATAARILTASNAARTANKIVRARAEGTAFLDETNETHAAKRQNTASPFARAATLRPFLNAAASLLTPLLPTATLATTATLLLAASPAAHAATYNWIGDNPASRAWGTNGNWSPAATPGTTPANNDTVSLDVLAHSTTLNGATLPVTGGGYLNGITASGSSELNGSYALTLSGAINFVSPNPATPALVRTIGNITLNLTSTLNLANLDSGESVLFDNASNFNATLNISGDISAAGRDITFFTAERTNTNVSGALGTVATLTKTGAGTLTLGNGSSTKTAFVQNFIFASGTVELLGADNVNNTTVLGSNSGGTLTLGTGSAADLNTLQLFNTSRTVAVQNVVFHENNSSLFLTRRNTPAHDNNNISLTFSNALGTFDLADSGTTLNTDSLTTLSIAQAVTGGILTKLGLGTLTLTNAASTFSGITHNVGILNALPTSASAGTNVTLDGSTASLLGTGPIVLSGTGTKLNLGSASSPALGAVTFGPGFSLTFSSGTNATFNIANAAAVYLTGGTVNFTAATAAGIYFDAPAYVGNTGFIDATGNYLTFHRDTTFTGTVTAASGVGFRFSPAAGTTQTLAKAGDPGTVTIAGNVLFTGPGTTVLGNSITALTPSSGLTLTGGKLQFSTTGQIAAATAITFDSPASAPAILDLGNNSYTFSSINIVSGAATFDFGPAANIGTTLNITGGTATGGTGVNSLRIRNWQGNNYNDTWSHGTYGDLLSLTGSLRTALSNLATDVWFYGYEKGAQEIGGYLYPRNGRLNSSFDNREDGKSGISDWRWHNPVNWAGDDPFNIPNAPGTAATFASSTGSTDHPGDLAGKIVSLGDTDATVGHISVSGTASGGIFTLGATGAGQSGKLIFDSDVSGTPAIFDFSTTSRLRVDIQSGVVLNSDLRLNLTSPGDLTSAEALKFNSLIEGTGKLIKAGTGTLHIGSQTANIFTGGVEFLQGTILVDGNNALGTTGPLTIGPRIGDDPLKLVSSKSGDGDAYRYNIANPLVIKSDFIVHNLNFTSTAPIVLGANYTLDINGGTDSGAGSLLSPAVIFSAPLQGGYAITVKNSFNNASAYSRLLRLDNTESTFTGSLTAGLHGSIGAYVQPDKTLVIGRPKSGATETNNFGQSGITLAGTLANFRVETVGATSEVLISGTGSGAKSILWADQATEQAFVSFTGPGIVTVDANAVIDIKGGASDSWGPHYTMRFANAVTKVNGGIFTLVSNGITTDRKEILVDFNSHSTTINGGAFTLSSVGTVAPTRLLFSNTDVDAIVDLQGGTINLHNISRVDFNAYHSENNIITLSENIQISGTTINAVDAGTAVLVTDSKVHFSGGWINGNGSLAIGSGGIWSMEGGTNQNTLNLDFRDVAQNKIGTLLSAGNGANGIVTFASVRKTGTGVNGLGIGFIDPSISEIHAASYIVRDGTLRVGAHNQIFGMGISARDATLLLDGTAAFFDTNEFHNTFGRLTLGGDGGTLVIGATGQLDFTNAGGGADWSTTKMLIVQSSDGTWATNGSGKYVRFSTSPATLDDTRLAKIAFSGYESGAKVLPSGGFYYLLPDALLTAEWIGNPSDSFSGTLWSQLDNWLSNSYIPGTGGSSLTSVTIRNVDENLKNKTIVVDAAYTLNRLNIETVTTPFTIGGASDGKLIFDGANPRIGHTMFSTPTLAVPVMLNADTELALSVGRHDGQNDGQFVWSGPISGSGSLTKSGTGDLKITNPGNTFSGGFNWPGGTSSGRLILEANTAADRTIFGTGVFTFGTAGTPTIVVPGVSRVSLPNGWKWASNEILLVYREDNNSADTAMTLRLDGNGTLSAGMHTVTTASSGNNQTKQTDPHRRLILNGNISGEADSSGITIGSHTGISLSGNSTFKGGVTMSSTTSSGGTASKMFLEIGSDSHSNASGALGTGPLTLYQGGYATHVVAFEGFASTGKAATLNKDTDGYRTITNQVIISKANTGTSGTPYLVLRGNLLFDREADANWKTYLTNTGAEGDTNTNYPLNLLNDDGGTPTFGKNFVFAGAGSIRLGEYLRAVSGSTFNYNDFVLRFLGSLSEYTGGTYFNGNTIQIGASSVGGPNNPTKGPFGTGTLYFPLLTSATQTATLVPFSEGDANATSQTLSNPVEFTGSKGVTVNALAGNSAKTLILDSGTPLKLYGIGDNTDKNTFTIGAGATLQISSVVANRDSDLAQAKGFIKAGPGDLALANSANTFIGGIQLNEGRVIARAGTNTITVASGQASGYFGNIPANTTTSQAITPKATSDIAFNPRATDYTNLPTAFVAESTASGGVHFGGSNPFYLNTTKALGTDPNFGPAFFVSGGTFGGTGLGLAVFDGGLTLTGTDPSHTANLPGWFVADHIRQSSGTSQIGINLRTNNLELAGTGILQMLSGANNRLSGVGKLTFAGGTLDLNGTSQALLGPEVPGVWDYVSGAVDVTAVSTLAFNGSSQSFTVGHITVAPTAKLNVTGWVGDSVTGLGNSRFITTGHVSGEIVDRIVMASGSYSALVRLNSEGQYVFVPLTNDYVWTGYASDNSSDPAGIWDRTAAHNSEAWTNWFGRDQGTHLNPPNLYDTVATFDTDFEDADVVRNLDNYWAAPLTVTIPGGSTTVGIIRILGSRAANITFAGSPLYMDFQGWDQNVAINVENASTFTVNAPLNLVTVTDQQTPANNKRNPLSVNTSDARAIVNLNGAVSGGEAWITKNGPGTLNLNGDNSTLTGGVILTDGTLNLGSANAIGGGHEGHGSLVLKGGTFHSTVAGNVAHPADASRTYDNKLVFDGDSTVAIHNGVTVTFSAGALVQSDSVFTLDNGGSGNGKFVLAPPATDSNQLYGVANAKLTLTGRGVADIAPTSILGTARVAVSGTNAAGNDVTVNILSTSVVAPLTATGDAATLNLASTSGAYSGAILNELSATTNVTGSGNTISGAVTNQTAGHFSVNAAGGTTTFSSPGTVTNQLAGLFEVLSGTGTTAFSSTVTNTGAGSTFNAHSQGTTTFSSNVTNTQGATFNAGNGTSGAIAFNSGVTNTASVADVTSTFNVNAANVTFLAVSNTITGDATVVNSKAIFNVEAATAIGGAIANTVTANAYTAGSRAILNVNAATTLTATATVINNSNGELNLNAPLTLYSGADAYTTNRITNGTANSVINVNTGALAQTLYGINYSGSAYGTVNVKRGTTALSLTNRNNAANWNLEPDTETTATGVLAIGGLGINFVSLPAEPVITEGEITTNAKLTWIISSNQTYSGILGGERNATIIKQGSTNLLLTGNNPFGNSTRLPVVAAPDAKSSLLQVEAGQVIVSSSGTLGYVDAATSANYTGRIDVRNGAALVFNTSAHQILSGTATGAGTGAIIQRGSGVLTVAAGAEIAAPNLSVETGSHLQVLGSGTVGTASFAANALLSGTGTIQSASFADSGTRARIAPGLPTGVALDTVVSDSTRDTLSFGASESSITVFENINYLLTLTGTTNTSLSDPYLMADTLAVTGKAAYLEGTNSLDLQGPLGAGNKYVIMTATNGIFSDDAGMVPYAVDTPWQVTNKTLNGVTWSGDLIPYLQVENVGGDAKRLVLLLLSIPDVLYWDSPVGNSLGWTNQLDTGSNPGNKIWRPGNKIGETVATSDIAFNDGDKVFFNYDALQGKPNNLNKNVVVRGDGVVSGVEVYAMTVTGLHSDFVFSGGYIKANETANSLKAGEYNAIGFTSGIFVEDGAKAMFKNEVFSNKMTVNGGATVQLEDDGFWHIGEINTGTPGNAGTVVFHKTTDDESNNFDGKITGAGSVRNIGDGVMSLQGDNSYTGDTIITDGILIVGAATLSGGGLGTRYDNGSNPTEITSRNYAGKISISNNALLGFSGQDRADANESSKRTQKLSGIIEGTAGTILLVTDGRRVEISGSADNTPTANPTPGSYNHFKGDLEVVDGGYLNVSGRLDVREEAFDQGTPWAATYTQHVYEGDMIVEGGAGPVAGGTLEFSYNRDWTLTTGTLSGAAGNNRGNFVVSTGQNFYFAGDASGYAGHTEIKGTGTVFHLPSGGANGAVWGLAGNAGNFVVQSGNALWGGGVKASDGTSFATTLNVGVLQMAPGSVLGVSPGGFKVNVANANAVQVSNNIRITIEAGTATAAGTFPRNLTNTEPVGAPGATKGAALTFANAGGVVFSPGSGVVLPAQVNLQIGGSILVNGSNLYEYVLIDGLHTQSIVSAAGVGGDADAAIAQIFGNNGKIQVMGAQFQLAFSGTKLIMTQMSLSSTIPEPSTYGLCGGLGVLALALWRRRGRKLKIKN